MGKVCDFKPIRLRETGRAVCRSLASVKETSLLGWVSLDFVRTRLSNMHRCCAFPFALPGLFLFLSSYVRNEVAVWFSDCPYIVSLQALSVCIYSTTVNLRPD